MPETALGIWLKNMRSARGLSLRKLAERSTIDHAYIYRLETGARDAPSDEVVEKLVSALSPSIRDKEILRFLVSHTNVEPKLMEFVQSNPEISFDEFHMLTTVVTRGAGLDYATSLARIRQFMS